MIVRDPEGLGCVSGWFQIISDEFALLISLVHKMSFVIMEGASRSRRVFWSLMICASRSRECHRIRGVLWEMSIVFTHVASRSGSVGGGRAADVRVRILSLVFLLLLKFVSAYLLLAWVASSVGSITAQVQIDPETSLPSRVLFQMIGCCTPFLWSSYSEVNRY
nr:uncharacterized protein LOC117276236 [Nicotiana tomentosiformis]